MKGLLQWLREAILRVIFLPLAAAASVLAFCAFMGDFSFITDGDWTVVLIPLSLGSFAAFFSDD